jgi:hypothetical protein
MFQLLYRLTLLFQSYLTNASRKPVPLEQGPLVSWYDIGLTDERIK